MVMTALIVKNRVEKILVVGPIYDKIDKLPKIQNYFNDYDLIVFNGNICYPAKNLADVAQRLQEIDKLLSSKVIYNLGRYDLQLLQKLWQDPTQKSIYHWIRAHPNVIIVNFRNGNNLIITDGGVTSEMTLASLHNNVETSFICKINNSPWHQRYGGGMGYIISNNPLTVAPPQYYNFSAQIGNVYSDQVNVYAQAINSNGLGSVFSL